jgi:25S rRNA (cytosine2870-C5)-methyltransferase
MVAKGKVSKKDKKKSRPESSGTNQKNVKKDQKRGPVVKKSVTPAKKQRKEKIVKQTKKSRGESKSKVDDDSSSPDDEIQDVLEESDVSEEEDVPAPKNLGRVVNAKKSKTVPAKNDSSEESDESSIEAKNQPGERGPAKKNDESSHSEEESSEEDSEDETEEATTQPKGKLFSDQNAAWLKPKKEKSQLLSSDSEEGKDEADEDSDDDEEMEVERKSRLLDAEMEMEEEEAEEEMRETVAKNTSVYHLPTKEELERDVDRVVPPSEIKSHIESILEVLADFSKRREPGRARTDYVEQLGSFMAELHGYLPELMHYFISMFGPSETVEFVDYSDKTRPMVIRTNTLKTRRKDLALALMKRGVTLDPLASWSKVGLKIIESPVPVGATPEYLSGHYMLQSAASMCPVLALDPQPKERVLDMSAAPGGKTSYLAQLMRNTGVIFANDLRPDRQKATVANMHRLGVKNVVACTHDGRKLGQIFKHYRFDRVLLDAPCSGLGVISRDPSVKVQRTLADVNKCAHLQKELLLAAIDVLNHKSKTSKGTMVYSTCSVSIAENEEVINYALQKRDIKIIDAGLDFGKRLHHFVSVVVLCSFH